VRAELHTLARPIADTVAKRLVATAELIDSAPELALQHAIAARRLASRVAVVREAVGLAAYHAGEWSTAVAELRTYHRMTGTQTHLAVLADCERALGRPDKAVDLFRSADRSKMASAEAIELLIVAAGARADLGQKDAAVAMLQVRELGEDEPYAARVRYAYADALLAAGRGEEAREWFSRAADVDTESETDAAERLLELDGVVLPSESDWDEDDLDDDDLDDEAVGDLDDEDVDDEADADFGDDDLETVTDDDDTEDENDDDDEADGDEDEDEEEDEDEDEDDEDEDDEDEDDEDEDDEDLDDELDAGDGGGESAGRISDSPDSADTDRRS